MQDEGKAEEVALQGVISQALCHQGHPNLCTQCRQSALALVALQLQEMDWSLLGLTWAQDPSRCCAENGASQALAGHGGPGMGWDEGGRGESWDNPHLPPDLHLSIWESGGAGWRDIKGQLFHWCGGLAKSAVCRWHEHTRDVEIYLWVDRKEEMP